MSYLNEYNLKQYVVVDAEGNHLEYFRLRLAALKWIQRNKKDYFSALEVIRNDK